ncbi:unnamed protein product [Paramecium primaurelia]|uniref:Transmembrane protein n=1 Tax=Paramecium primaurelia TaxID=5886 RepID=A0A8S1P987_PARPR|nr:unnamed protein product [Paramecium primaurelia]
MVIKNAKEDLRFLFSIKSKILQTLSLLKQVMLYLLILLIFVMIILYRFIGIKWTYSVDESNGNDDFDNFVATLTSLQMLELVIPFQTLLKQSNITFYLEFQNFVAQKYTYYKIVNSFRSISKHSFGFKIFIIRLLKLLNDSNSRPSRVNYQESARQSFINVTIQNYTLTSRITLEISSGGIFCQFNGTKKIQNYRKETQIQISCRGLDTQYDWNEDSDIQINIECVDLNLNSLCMDLNIKIIKVNKIDSIQIIPKQSIQTYTIQCQTVVNLNKKLSIQIMLHIVKDIQ